LKTEYRTPLWKEDLKPLSAVEIESVDKGMSFIHVYGAIRYVDVFDDPQKVPFHYRWETAYQSWFGGTKFGQWIEIKPKNDEKKET